MEASAVIPALMPQQLVPLEAIQPSKTNPKGRISGPEFDDLVASVRRNGVLVPILVRPDGDLYQVVAGSRRVAAARAAGVMEIPAVVREMSEATALELQLIENVQRADLHPLEEAEGYRRLMQLAKLDAAGVSERIGRSVAYVYDRVKLLELTPEAREHFLAGRILAGHAVILARLKPADQKDALARGTFTRQELLFDEADKSTHGSTKHVSVRELQSWVDRNVGFDVKNVDPMLFPQTAMALEKAEDAGRKIVAVTYGNYTPPTAKTGMGDTRIYHAASWKRADGEEKSKTCECSVQGFVHAGVRRGDSFLVCVDKDKCIVHWAERVRARRSRATTAARSSSGGGGAAPRESKRDPKLEKALEQANKDASRAIDGAVMAAAGQMSPDRFLRVLVVMTGSWDIAQFAKQRQLQIPTERGKLKAWAAKAPVRTVIELLAFGALQIDAEEASDVLGIDSKAICKRHEDAARAALKGESAKPVAGTCRKCGCTDDNACEGGCTWVDKEHTLCSGCDPSLDVPRVKASAAGAPRKRKTTSLKPKKAAKKAASKRSR